MNTVPSLYEPPSPMWVRLTSWALAVTVALGSAAYTVTHPRHEVLRAIEYPVDRCVPIVIPKKGAQVALFT
jgi:hypothetical protein